MHFEILNNPKFIFNFKKRCQSILFPFARHDSLNEEMFLGETNALLESTSEDSTPDEQFSVEPTKNSKQKAQIIELTLGEEILKCLPFSKEILKWLIICRKCCLCCLNDFLVVSVALCGCLPSSLGLMFLLYKFVSDVWQKLKPGEQTWPEIRTIAWDILSADLFNRYLVGIIFAVICSISTMIYRCCICIYSCEKNLKKRGLLIFSIFFIF